MQTASQKSSNENLTLKAYEKKVKDDIRLINENLFDMMKLFKIEDDRTVKMQEEFGLNRMSQSSIDSFEIKIRVANILKSTESLSKIVSDLKDMTILNDFKSINQQITNQCNVLKSKEFEIDRQLTFTKDGLIKLLNDLEQQYYSSNFK